ncbi:hypothetical protein FF38_02412 [Lucilia cuprina]|uniref:Uncharacterized protein n=1 Tax=Lucilia cuprina TaxID=7375 RepID=A0A0L0CAG9_LUCCU|nr:hypothetical protein FF38_02412 [Lucilia cuprina]
MNFYYILFLLNLFLNTKFCSASIEQNNERLSVLRRFERSPDFDTIVKPLDYQRSDEREKVEFPVWDDAKGEYISDNTNSS